MLPASLTFTQALQPGGCLHNFSQVRITRHNLVFEPNAPLQPTSEAGASRSSSNSSSNETTTTTSSSSSRDSSGGGGKCKGRSSSTSHPSTIMGSCSRSSSSSTGASNSSSSTTTGGSSGSSSATGGSSSSTASSIPPAKADIYTLAGGGGWKTLLGQRYYIDAAPALGVRWSHKALVDPNMVSWFDVHEGQVMPGGRDSGTAVPEACAFGLHVVNMFNRRTLGSGKPLEIVGGRPFMLSEHWERVARAMQHQGRPWDPELVAKEE